MAPCFTAQPARRKGKNGGILDPEPRLGRAEDGIPSWRWSAGFAGKAVPTVIIGMVRFGRVFMGPSESARPLVIGFEAKWVRLSSSL